MSRATPRGKRGREVHRHLLSDPAVRAWYNERALRSRLSADTYLRQLGASLQRLKLSPAELAEEAAKEPERLCASLVSYASGLKRLGRRDAYISKTFDGLRSWLRHRRVSFDGFPKLSPVRGETLERERVPTPEELRRVLDRLTPRGRTIALLMAHAGLRPGVLGSYGAEDGLRLDDLPELKRGRRPAFDKVPFAIRVPGRLSKTRKTYTTFGSQELSSNLLASLDERTAHGEVLSGDSPVVTVDSFAATHDFHGKKGAGRFLTTKGIVFELREALVANQPKGVTWRPYVLRGYCSTRLLLAESQGKISRDLREALLGHDGGVAARYNVGKAWGAELLEDARAAYARCEPFLTTGKTAATLTEADLKKAILSVFLPDDEVAKLDVAKLSSDDVRALVATRVAERQVKSAAPALVPGSPHVPPEPVLMEPTLSAEDVVPFDQVRSRLAVGWTWVAALGNGEAVLRRPQ